MDQQENNQQNAVADWELPTEFLSSRLDYNDNTKVYEFGDNYLKFFNFQTTVPPDTEEEKKEQEQAMRNQVKLGILREEHIQSLSYPTELQIMVSPVVITVLNGKSLINKVEENKKLNTIIDSILHKTPTVNKKVGRNDPCPCGSGKKYKICHGR